LLARIANPRYRVTTKEKVRYDLSENMVSLVEALKPAFTSGSTFETFEKNVIGNNSNTKEGKSLLKKVFEYIANKTSRNEILTRYSGSEMAAACLYVNDENKNNPKSDGSELFGGSTGDFNPYPATIAGRTAPCRWYQLSCWANQIFGETGGTTITTGIIKFLLSLIIP
jgi:hypothetical protein